MRALAAALLTGYAALVMAGGSAAATAAVDGDDVRYTAAPGESNVIAIVVDAEGVRIRDLGATIVAGSGCIALAASEVHCSKIADSDGIFDIELTAGDEDDVVTSSSVSGAWAAFDWAGDEGDDRLVVCVPPDDWPNFLDGGPGNDRLEICPELPSGPYPPGLHDMKGGPGDDTLVGGRGLDVLFGGPGRDTLIGKQSSDLLDGGIGADRLRGGAGRDTLRGGEGRDRLFARDGKADRVYGGPDRDVARVDARRDVVRAVEVLL